MMSFLNLGSFLLGLIAWILPVINLMRYKKHDRWNWVILSVLSMSACAFSLFFQIYYIYHKVKISDWAALMDTMNVIVFAATVLLIVTIILNAITMLVYRDKTANLEA